jgi:chorismate-pyruvate lyase
MQIVSLGQEQHPLTADDPWLEAPVGTATIERQVVLRGLHSATAYVYGDSTLCIERLPEHMHRDLVEGTAGIGHLVHRYQLETRRQLLWCGIERQVFDGVRGDFLYRTYRIISGGHPLMVINERFPLV